MGDGWIGRQCQELMPRTDSTWHVHRNHASSCWICGVAVGGLVALLAASASLLSVPVVILNVGAGVSAKHIFAPITPYLAYIDDLLLPTTIQETFRPVPFTSHHIHCRHRRADDSRDQRCICASKASVDAQKQDLGLRRAVIYRMLKSPSNFSPGVRSTQSCGCPPSRRLR